MKAAVIAKGYDCGWLVPSRPERRHGGLPPVQAPGDETGCQSLPEVPKLGRRVSVFQQPSPPYLPEGPAGRSCHGHGGGPVGW